MFYPCLGAKLSDCLSAAPGPAPAIIAASPCGKLKIAIRPRGAYFIMKGEKPRVKQVLLWQFTKLLPPNCLLTPDVEEDLVKGTEGHEKLNLT